jgi:RimJ/RimL family protein N-acetyltransferase
MILTSPYIRNRTDVVHVYSPALPHVKPLIRAHLIKLSDDDKYKRFFSPVSDTRIDKYINDITLDNKKDAVFVVYNKNGTEIVGMCHVAVSETDTSLSAELALSVDETCRHQHIGINMLERAVLHCKAFGIRQVFMHCLSTNRPMQNMAKKLGMAVVAEFGESTGSLNIPQTRIPTALAEAITADTLALYDLSCRQVVNAVYYMMTRGMYAPQRTSSEESV